MIGIFDSGSGGLTVLKALREEMPSADVVYFGDIKNAPYGEKTQEELTTLTIASISFLQTHGATSIISACNSVSASLSLSLIDMFALPGNLIEMVGPTVGMFRGTEERVALVATPATIRSHIYQNAFRMVGIEVETIAIPELAAAIEFGSSRESIDAMVAHSVAHLSPETCSALVLACTHYPLAFDSFRAHTHADIAIIDPAIAVAERAKKQLQSQEGGGGTTTLYISGDSDIFRERVKHLFPKGEITIEVVE